MCLCQRALPLLPQGARPLHASVANAPCPGPPPQAARPWQPAGLARTPAPRPSPTGGWLAGPRPHPRRWAAARRPPRRRRPSTPLPAAGAGRPSCSPHTPPRLTPLVGARLRRAKRPPSVRQSCQAPAAGSEAEPQPRAQPNLTVPPSPPAQAPRPPRRPPRSSTASSPPPLPASGRARPGAVLPRPPSRRPARQRRPRAGPKRRCRPTRPPLRQAA